MNLLSFQFTLPPVEEGKPILFVATIDPSLATLMVARLLDLAGSHKVHVLTHNPGLLAMRHPGLVTHACSEAVPYLSLALLPETTRKALQGIDFGLALYAERSERDWIDYQNIIRLFVDLKIDEVGSISEHFVYDSIRTLYSFKPFMAGSHKVAIEGISLMDPDEREFLYHLAFHAPDPGTIVEIGSYAGGSTLIMAYARQDRGRGQIYAIDAAPRPTIDQDLAKHGVTDSVHLFKMASRDVAAGWHLFSGQKPEINMLWIDGDHSYNSCRLDIALWSPYLIPGGTICFHDYSDNCDCSGVIRAVHEAIIMPGEYEDFRLVNKVFAATKKGAKSHSPRA
ncbi:MAG: class I SAM-dependent methyltransferase [Holophaga sp.]|nr:class I SAM-dependent methyltransferase [Holophaga sp.]